MVQRQLLLGAGILILAIPLACRSNRSVADAIVPSPTFSTLRLGTARYTPGSISAASTVKRSKLGGEHVGGTPESVGETDDCRVRIKWFSVHDCGTELEPVITWSVADRTIIARVKRTGQAEGCPQLVTRFDTLIGGLPLGQAHFDTQGKVVDLTVTCLTD